MIKNYNKCKTLFNNNNNELDHYKKDKNLTQVYLSKYLLLISIKSLINLFLLIIDPYHHKPFNIYQKENLL